MIILYSWRDISQSVLSTVDSSQLLLISINPPPAQSPSHSILPDSPQEITVLLHDVSKCHRESPIMGSTLSYIQFNTTIRYFIDLSAYKNLCTLKVQCVRFGGIE